MKSQRIIRRWIIIAIIIIPLVSSLKHENYHNYKVEGRVLLLSILMIQGGSNNYHYRHHRRQRQLYPTTTTINKKYKSRYNDRDTQRYKTSYKNYNSQYYDRSYDDSDNSIDDSYDSFSSSYSEYNSIEDNTDEYYSSSSSSGFDSNRKKEEQIISALMDSQKRNFNSNRTSRSKKNQQKQQSRIMNHNKSPTKEKEKKMRPTTSTMTTTKSNNNNNNNSDTKVVYSPTTMQHPNTMLYQHHQQQHQQQHPTTTRRLQESKIDSNNNLNINRAPFIPYPERNNNPNYYSSYGRSNSPLYPNGNHNYPNNNNNRIQSPGIQQQPQRQSPTNPHLSNQGRLKTASLVTSNNNLKSSSTGFVSNNNNHHREHTTTTTTTLQKKKQRPIIPSSQQQPTTMSLTTPWARSFILSRPKDALLPIPREFLADGFNLVRLAPIVERFASLFAASQSQTNDKSNNHNNNNNDYHQMTNNNSNSTSITFPLFRAGLNLILEEKRQDDEEGGGTTKFAKKKAATKKVPPEIQFAAEIIYTLVHARYISSPRGLDTIRRMFQQQQINKEIVPIFGRCPRMQCRGMPLLPCGLTDEYHHNYMEDRSSREDTINSIRYKAKRFCPSCGEAFHMWESKVDGSAWGKSFCHLFLLTHGHELFPQLLREKQGFSSSSDANSIEPRIFGYKIHPLAHIRYPFKDS